MTKKEKIQEAYNTWEAEKTPANMSAMLTALDSTITSVSSVHGAARDENLKWAIKIHLAKDISNRYDKSKGTSLPTFVYQSLQRIPRIKAQQKNLIHVPESSDADIRHLQNIRQILIDKHEREPTTGEISDRSGISTSRIDKLESRFGKPFMTVSKFDAASGGVGPSGSHEEAQGATDNLYHKYAVDTLEPIDRKIYDWLSVDNPMQKSQIASNLSISPPAVTQRISKINKHLMGE